MNVRCYNYIAQNFLRLLSVVIVILSSVLRFKNMQSHGYDCLVIQTIVKGPRGDIYIILDTPQNSAVRGSGQRW